MFEQSADELSVALKLKKLNVRLAFRKRERTTFFAVFFHISAGFLTFLDRHVCTFCFLFNPDQSQPNS